MTDNTLCLRLLRSAYCCHGNQGLLLNQQLFNIFYPTLSFSHKRIVAHFFVLSYHLWLLLLLFSSSSISIFSGQRNNSTANDNTRHPSAQASTRSCSHPWAKVAALVGAKSSSNNNNNECLLALRRIEASIWQSESKRTLYGTIETMKLQDQQTSHRGKCQLS